MVYIKTKITFTDQRQKKQQQKNICEPQHVISNNVVFWQV